MRISLLVVIFLIPFLSLSQTKTINGQVIAQGDNDIEGIPILNKTTTKYTITDEKGKFKIPVSLNDTLTISALKFNTVELKITQSILNDSILKIQLEEKINELDEVVVGKVLTGDLISDIKNSNIKAEINFYDLGIPGKTDLPPIIEQRRLNEADAGPLFGFPTVNVHKLLNLISGRTKRLKAQLKIAKKEACLNRMMNEFSDELFASETLIDTLQIHFFYFATDDERYSEMCKETDIKQMDFLLEKLKAFKLLFLKEEED